MSSQFTFSSHFILCCREPPRKIWKQKLCGMSRTSLLAGNFEACKNIIVTKFIYCFTALLQGSALITLSSFPPWMNLTVWWDTPVHWMHEEKYSCKRARQWKYKRSCWKATKAATLVITWMRKTLTSRLKCSSLSVDKQKPQTILLKNLSTSQRCKP